MSWRQQQEYLEREQWEMEQKKVYGAIAAVMKDLAAIGIAKDQKNSQQGYNFRGIDAAYNALAPILSRHGLVILPRVTEREVTERQTKNGGALFYTTVKMEFDLVSIEDGSKHTVGPMVGEAMDSGDKSSNKAMSAAYKYMAFQTFCIPTQGDNDADATTHVVAAREESHRDVSPERAKVVRAIADACIAKHAKGDEWGCYEERAALTDSEEVLLLWDYLKPHSKVRSSIKHYSQLDRAGEKSEAVAA